MMTAELEGEGVPYQSLPTYSDPFQDILSEDAVTFAPHRHANNNGGHGEESGVVVGAGAALPGQASPTRFTRSLSNDRLERGERDPLLSTGESHSPRRLGRVVLGYQWVSSACFRVFWVFI